MDLAMQINKRLDDQIHQYQPQKKRTTKQCFNYKKKDSYNKNNLLNLKKKLKDQKIVKQKHACQKKHQGNKVAATSSLQNNNFNLKSHPIS